ncbi:MAG: lactate utilization protein [Desulfobacula sp.]|uniref:lactate utilization protein n=1 Tax=Desulfobacula sp. TaxID=2593537 RepID=UPI0025BEE4F5|nr:lactate utilization protein [Desulfobacula sp.]MCD4718520.1 lactate utilization protein [Desulfobacula sp.]
METEGLVRIMTKNAAAVGTIVHEIFSVSDAIQYAIDLTIVKKLKTLACPGLDTKNRDMMSDLCKSTDLDLLNPLLRENGPTLDTSLTWAEYGIADTGTLMVASDSEEIRIATMLARIHIAMLPISKIRPDTVGIETELNAILKSDSPSYTAFITGASRTADIERVLTIGVHGPVELHLLLLKTSGNKSTPKWTEPKY